MFEIFLTERSVLSTPEIQVYQFPWEYRGIMNSGWHSVEWHFAEVKLAEIREKN